MTDIVVALIVAVPGTIGAIAAVKAAYRVKTSNGHTTGELAEKNDERLASLELKFDEHIRNHEMDRGL